MGWNCRFSTRRTSSRSSWRSSTTRSTASLRTIVAAKFGITWSSSEKSHWNGRVKEISEFYIRHHFKTKISRGSEHFFLDFLAEYRTWKMKELYEWFKGVSARRINSQWKFPRYHSGKEWKAKTESRSEMPVRTVSQKFSPLQWGRLFKELCCRPTRTADFSSSFRLIPYTSHVCWLDDNIQDWCMYLFTISYGSCAMDQRSGDGWFSGWIKIFVIYSWYFNAEIWSTRCEDCFSIEQNHP